MGRRDPSRPRVFCALQSSFETDLHLKSPIDYFSTNKIKICLLLFALKVERDTVAASALRHDDDDV